MAALVADRFAEPIGERDGQAVYGLAEEGRDLDASWDN